MRLAQAASTASIFCNPEVVNKTFCLSDLSLIERDSASFLRLGDGRERTVGAARP